jgi:hypothetical protein
MGRRHQLRFRRQPEALYDPLGGINALGCEDIPAS